MGDVKKKAKQKPTAEELAQQQAEKQQADINSFKERLEKQKVKIKGDKYAFIWSFTDLLRDGVALRNEDNAYLQAAQTALNEASTTAPMTDTNGVSLAVAKAPLADAALNLLNTKLDASATKRVATGIFHAISSLLPPGVAFTAENWEKESTAQPGSRYAKAAADLTHQDWYRTYLFKMATDFAQPRAAIFGNAVVDWAHQDVDAALFVMSKAMNKELSDALKDDASGVNTDAAKLLKLRALAAKLLPADLPEEHKTWLSAEENDVLEKLRFFAQEDAAKTTELQQTQINIDQIKARIKIALNGKAGETLQQDVAAYTAIVNNAGIIVADLIAQADRLIPLLNDAAKAKFQAVRNNLNANQVDAALKQELQRLLVRGAAAVQDHIAKREAALVDLTDLNKEPVDSLKDSMEAVQKNLAKTAKQRAAQFEAAKRAGAERVELNKIFNTLNTFQVDEFNAATKIPLYKAIIKSQDNTNPAERAFYENSIKNSVNAFLTFNSATSPRTQEVFNAELQALKALGVIELDGSNRWIVKLSTNKPANAELLRNDQEIQIKKATVAKKIRELSEQAQRFDAGMALAAGLSKAEKRPDPKDRKLDPTDGKASNETIYEMAKAVTNGTGPTAHAKAWHWLQNRRQSATDVMTYAKTREVKAEIISRFTTLKQTKEDALLVHKESVENVGGASKSAVFEINGLKEGDKELPAEILRAGLKVQTHADLSDADKLLFADMDETIDVTKDNWFVNLDLNGTKFLINAYEYQNSDGSKCFYINVIDPISKVRKGVDSGSDLEKHIAELLVNGLSEQKAKGSFLSKDKPRYAVEFAADYKIATMDKSVSQHDPIPEITKSRRISR